MQKKIARKIASITAVSLASGLITVPAGANADLTPNLQIMQKTEIISDEALFCPSGKICDTKGNPIYRNPCITKNSKRSGST